MVKEKEDAYFVGLEEPNELRRTILESTRDIVDVLKKFEEFKSVRDEKTKEIEKLRSDMRGISRLIVKLKAELPKTKLRMKLYKHEKVVKRKVLTGEKKVKKKELTELDKLESELGEIEGKLKNIG